MSATTRNPFFPHLAVELQLPPPPMLLSSSSAAAARVPLFRSPRSPPFKPSYLKPRLSATSASCSPSPLHLASDSEPGSEALGPASAAALAAAIRRASPVSPVEFAQRVEKPGAGGLVLPTGDFQRLCVAQLDLFRMIVHHHAVLSVYVRPAGNYVMDQLELRRVTFYPGVDMSENADCVILVGKFAVAAGLRAAESALLKLQVEFLPEFGAMVLPMVKHPFVVGFLVAEIPDLEYRTSTNVQDDEQNLPLISWGDGPPRSNERISQVQVFKEDLVKSYGQFTTKQSSRAVMISCSLAMAYVMDQKALLLQQSSWHNNIRMSHLVEQIRAPLSNIRALSKMLSFQLKRSEISYDIVESILVQGDHMKDALQQLQDAVYITKANMVRYNDEKLNKMHNGIHGNPESGESNLSDYSSSELQNDSSRKMNRFLSVGSGRNDMEMPMPPPLLAPLHQHTVRPCTASDILTDLVEAALPLAKKQQRSIELSVLSQQLLVAVEESALRQALSNLIEGALLRTQVGGRVEIYTAGAPAGGVLIIIDDNGPDMHYMTQMHSLTPFGAELFSDGTAEDNMTWNFVAGLTVAREILESFGSVIRVISPRMPDLSFGAGGTRIELWLPAPTSDLIEPAQEA